MKKFLTILGLSLAIMALLVGASAAETIKIGVAAPFTGDAAAYGDNILRRSHGQRSRDQQVRRH
jgi:hypothetical protein